jgi:hypothetical protein
MAPGATSPSPSLTRRVPSLSPIGGEGQKRRIPLSDRLRGERVGVRWVSPRRIRKTGVGLGTCRRGR